ncbi:MAG: PAAR domain-containing protein, partial [Pseudomonadota bacterium]
MTAFITVECTTDHGGIIVSGDSSFVVEGKAVHLDGMAHYCPKCKVQSRAIASNQGFMTVGGKSIVAVGD